MRWALHLDSSGKLLLRFARFADRSKHRGPLTADLALRGLVLPQKASLRYRAERLSIVRGFARHLAAEDGRSQVPDRRLLGQNHYRLQPHIYSDRQLRELVLAAAKLPPVYRLRPHTYSTLFGLLASTGLRVSEALNLNKEHVDLARGILRIEETKFRKSRLVPLHPTATRALRRYARERDRERLARDSDAFFVGGHGQSVALQHRARHVPAFVRAIALAQQRHAAPTAYSRLASQLRLPTTTPLVPARNQCRSCDRVAVDLPGAWQGHRYVLVSHRHRSVAGDSRPTVRAVRKASAGGDHEKV